jgi:hypothetical protein
MPRSLVSRVRPSPALIIAIVALFVALGGVAYATIPGSDGVIHGCYLNKNGTLRVIDPGAGQKCSGFETAVQWNQTGPRGLQGLQGSPGAAGPAGPAGPTGPGVSYWFRTDSTGHVVASGPGAIQVTDLGQGYYRVVGQSDAVCGAIGTSNEGNISTGATGASSVSVRPLSGSDLFVELWQAQWPVTGPMGTLEAGNTGTGTPNVTVVGFCQ